MMDEYGKSDSPVVPEKSSNKVPKGAAEAMEKRGLAKGNPPKGKAPRTQSRIGGFNALERVREAARRDRKQRFTALFHHDEEGELGA